MAKDTPIINILTYGLPFDLANQIFNEFQSRLAESKYLIERYKPYKELQKHIKTTELLLSLSIFHKRVIANLDAAVKFYGTVSTHSQAQVIKMGSYDLTGDERNRLLAVVISYRKLIEKFSLSSSDMEYLETKEFLKKLINLKSFLGDDDEEHNNTQDSAVPSDDFPF